MGVLIRWAVFRNTPAACLATTRIQVIRRRAHREDSTSKRSKEKGEVSRVQNSELPAFCKRTARPVIDRSKVPPLGLSLVQIPEIAYLKSRGISLDESFFSRFFPWQISVLSLRPRRWVVIRVISNQQKYRVENVREYLWHVGPVGSASLVYAIRSPLMDCEVHN